MLETGDVPRAGLCEDRPPGRVGGVAGEIRFSSCDGGVEEHRGGGGGGASLKVDGHGDGE